MLGLRKDVQNTDLLYSRLTSLLKAHSKGEAKQLAAEFNSIIERLIVLNRKTGGTLFKKNYHTVITELDKSELSEMDKDFRKEFIKGGRTVRLTERKLDNGLLHYEIRYRSNNYSITAETDNLDEAKKQFIEMTKPENIKKAIRVGGINI